MKIAIAVREYNRHGGFTKEIAEITERLAKLYHEVCIFFSKKQLDTLELFLLDRKG